MSNIFTLAFQNSISMDIYNSLDDAEVKQQFWDILSAAMASSASGKVNVILPTGGTHLPGVWGTSEFPQLQLNEAVTEINRLDPDSKEQTLIWSRTDGYTDPTSQTWPLDTPFSDTTVWPLKA